MNVLTVLFIVCITILFTLVRKPHGSHVDSLVCTLGNNIILWDLAL